jgi:hypothetical protein
LPAAVHGVGSGRFEFITLGGTPTEGKFKKHINSFPHKQQQ